METLTKENFDAINRGEVFASGNLPNSPEGLYMTDSNKGDDLRWIAKKGYGYDWAIYCYWATKSDDWIEASGDKVRGKEHIRKCVPCDDEVLNLYRH